MADLKPARGTIASARAGVRRVFRFAPSPNGYLHLGHAFSALLNRRLAEESGGRLLLRIEDIDPERSRPHFEAAIIEDLAWLGLAWEQTPRRQSEHMSDYRAALDQLTRRGLAYPCFCSRKEIAEACADRKDWPLDPDFSPLYPGACRHLSMAERASRIAGGARFALRLDMEKALAEAAAPLIYREFHEGSDGAVVGAAPALWGDAPIGRRDAPTSYHLACTLDDHLQGVTDVVRGVDLEAATGLHRLLQALLGLRTPDYRHHRLVRDEHGRKLAKSKSAVPLRELRAKGTTPEALRAFLALEMGRDF
ncbi:tRNA glutamyl-Q(34) synthetase GluQRS [uncultured Rhodoblastus sp.]|uniref:tRNA glutamyl-Q(34) synthetase GluQRS n=1 Tax=uncultured Rhodoblastus sp. TaxID=543037 RepID=UPI0025D616E4|nr:tRNA glutamyl-Q(34) synthetase GluQRS [uncultured Rhodoblastus sp.]